jgi:cell wall-associated NlpC family hydrolase
MNWKDYYKRWADRASSTGKLDPGVTFVNEQWEVPGEAPLTVRLCTRQGHPMSSFARMTDTPKHSITLHHTSGYGGFNSLMGDRAGSAHFMIGRDGNAYRIVDTEKVAWHANMWSWNSIGIEVDNIGQLKLKGDTLYDEYGGAYCKKSDQDVWIEKDWPNYGKYWATWSEEQYVVIGRLLKALCARHNIPKMILPDERRYKGFTEEQQKKFRGICMHVNVKPHNRDDLGPYVDWAKIIRFAGLSEGDCFGLGPPGPQPEHPPKKKTAPADPKQKSPPPPPPKKSDARPSPGRQQTLAPPEQVDAHTVRVSVGASPGRISLTVKSSAEELKPAPAGQPPEAPKDAEGKRDKFVAAALSFKGTPYLNGSDDPAKGGLDGPGLIALCLKKVGVKLDHDDESPLNGPALAAHFPPIGGDAHDPPEGILPGDIAWFGEGDHDHSAQQHAMIWLGGGKLLGPEPGNKSEFHGQVWVLDVKDVGETFAGFSHIAELGEKTAAGAPHHDAEPPGSTTVSGALLPDDPHGRYAALQGVVKDAGGSWVSDAGKVNLVGVTNLNDLCQISPRRGSWNDTLFAAWVDADGHKHVIDVRASLDPSHDIDPAGTWHLLEGAYKFKLDKDALVPDGKVRGWQDEKGKGTKPPPEPPPAAAKGDVQVSPLVRGLAQYDKRWNQWEHPGTPLRGEPPAEGKKLPSSQRWQDNACHCTSVTMVFRWIEDKTKGAFKFPSKPGTALAEDDFARRLMEFFWPDLGGRVPEKGSEPGDAKDKVPHNTLRKLAEDALGMKPKSCRVSLSGGLEKRLASLKKALAKGPVVMLMPGHYVVLQAINGDSLCIVDPGNVLSHHWQHEDGTPIKENHLKPPASAWPGVLDPHHSDRNGAMYVKIPVTGKIATKDGKTTGTFIELLQDAESYWWAGGE